MTGPTAAAFDLRASYEVGDQVVLRREAFGGLAYDLHTRTLRVLRDPDLVTVLERLDSTSSANEALAVVDAPKRRRVLAALVKLEREGLIRVV